MITNKILKDFDIILSSNLSISNNTLFDAINAYKHGDAEFALNTLKQLKTSFGKDIVVFDPSFDDRSIILLEELSKNINLIDFKKKISAEVTSHTFHITFSINCNKKHKIQVYPSRNGNLIFKLYEPTSFLVKSLYGGLCTSIRIDKSKLNETISLTKKMLESKTIEDYKNNILSFYKEGLDTNFSEIEFLIEESFKIIEKIKPFISSRYLPNILSESSEYSISLLLVLRNNYGLFIELKRLQSDIPFTATLFAGGNFSSILDSKTLEVENADELFDLLKNLFKRRS